MNTFRHPSWKTLLATATLVASFGQAQVPASLPASVYEHVIRHVNHIKNKSVALAAQKKTTSLGSYYKDLGALTQAETDAMNSVALTAVAELDALDQQARALILQFRASLTTGQKPAAPPGELVALQAKRNAALAKHHGNLIQILGPVTFKRLDQALLSKKSGTGK